MNSKELNTLLLNRIPALKNIFEEETSWQEGIETGSYVVFEDIFMPYIIYCVENNINDEINSCFNFIEECVYSDDNYQKSVATISIIDNIHSYDIKDKLSSFLRKESLKLYNKQN